MAVNFEDGFKKPPTDEVIELSADDLIEGEGNEEEIIELPSVYLETAEDEYSLGELIKQTGNLLENRSLLKDVGVTEPTPLPVRTQFEQTEAGMIRFMEVQKINNGVAMLGTLKSVEARPNAEAVEDAVVIKDLPGGGRFAALGDSHNAHDEVTGKEISGTGADTARSFTDLFQQFEGVQSLQTGTVSEVKKEFVDKLSSIAGNFNDGSSEITCSFAQIADAGPDGSRRAVIYNVGDSAILKFNKGAEGGQVEQLGKSDALGVEIYGYISNKEIKLDPNHKLASLVEYFRSQPNVQGYDYHAWRKMIMEDSSLPPEEKSGDTDKGGKKHGLMYMLETINAAVTAGLTVDKLTEDRVEVLDLKAGEGVVMLSDGLLDNIDVNSPDFTNAIKLGRDGFMNFVNNKIKELKASGVHFKDDDVSAVYME